MVAFTNLLQYAGYSTDIIGAAAGGWHTSTKIMEGNLKRDARPIAYLVTEPPPVAERPPGPIPGPSAGSARREPGWLLWSMIERADQPYVPAKLPRPGALRPLSTGPANDEEEIEPEAEKLLMAKLAAFTDFLWGVATGLLGWLWRRFALLGWLRLAVAVPFALALFVVGSALVCVALPFAISGFLLDSGKDFRLRIVMLAFMAGICLEVVSSLLS